jgi:hypothetical protein
MSETMENKNANILQIQVTSINGSESTINFQRKATGGICLENEHITKTSKLGVRDFKLLKRNRVLLEILYVQRFIGYLKDKYGITFLELSPKAWCEIISILLEHPKILKKSKEGIVAYTYSNRTYAYFHFFDLLFGSFQDLDKEGTMRTLRLLNENSKQYWLRYSKRFLLHKKETDSLIEKENI